MGHKRTVRWQDAPTIGTKVVSSIISVAGIVANIATRVSVTTMVFFIAISGSLTSPRKTEPLI